MDLILNIIFSIIGVFIFLYLFWRKLKDDYSQNQIFTAGFYSIFGFFIFNFFSSNFMPDFLFWISLAGAFLGLIVVVNRLNIRVFEAIEAWTIGALSGFLLVLLRFLIQDFDLESLVRLTVVLALIFVYFLFDKHYKKFTWYKSGKVGFTGLSTLGFTFVALIFIAIFLPNMLFFLGRLDAIISGVFAFAAFSALYNLSQKTI